MLIGLLMILAPCAIFIFSLPFSRRLQPPLRKVYRLLGGLFVFVGGSISVYLASYTGDQGGIGAFFFQIAVILVYSVFSVSLVILNWVLGVRKSGNSRG